MIPRICIVLAAATVLPAAAATLLSTGFESPAFSTGPIAGQNGWAVFGTSVAVQVESGVAQSGSQAVEVIPSLAASQTGPYYALSTAASFVEMSAYIELGSSSNQSVWQFAATGSGFSGFIGGVNIQSTGAIDLITGARVQEKSEHSGGIHSEFHVGPHIMIITPHQDELQSMNRDGSAGMPYVAHPPNQTDVFLVMPIREWSDK